MNNVGDGLEAVPPLRRSVMWGTGLSPSHEAGLCVQGFREGALMKRALMIAVSIGVVATARPVSTQSPSAEPFSGLRARSIGPAVTSGRVMTVAVDPANTSTFYVGAASGGVWKTVNGGASFQPVFDTQGSFSIGWVAVDPKRSNVVWVGTGER